MLLFFHSLKFNYIFHLQSNLKSKDVVLKQIAAGSMTVPGTFYKNKLPDHRGSCVCAPPECKVAARRGRQGNSQLGSI